MNELLYTLLVTVTIYHADPKQTDSTPFITASNQTTSSASNLYDSTFYFVTSDFNVYKVLDNNGGTAYSGAEPTSTSTSPFALGGYVLKYMYTITQSEISKFVTTDFIPVSTDSTVSAAATDG